MNTKIKQIIIAFVLGTFAINANASNVTPKVGGIESKDGFSSFISKKTGKFKRRNLENFNKYNEVVNLYYTSPVAFYNLSEEEQIEFKIAAENLTSSLNDSRKQESKNWAGKVNMNKSIFEFIWASKKLASPGNEVVLNF